MECTLLELLLTCMPNLIWVMDEVTLNVMADLRCSLVTKLVNCINERLLVRDLEEICCFIHIWRKYICIKLIVFEPRTSKLEDKYEYKYFWTAFENRIVKILPFKSRKVIRLPRTWQLMMLSACFLNCLPLLEKVTNNSAAFSVESLFITGKTGTSKWDRNLSALHTDSSAGECCLETLSLSLSLRRSCPWAVLTHEVCFYGSEVPYLEHLSYCTALCHKVLMDIFTFDYEKYEIIS
jgi:hypothetical protein